MANAAAGLPRSVRWSRGGGRLHGAASNRSPRSPRRWGPPAASSPRARARSPTVREVDAEVRLGEVDERLATELAGLGPFGQQNPAPVLVTRNATRHRGPPRRRHHARPRSPQAHARGRPQHDAQRDRLRPRRSRGRRSAPRRPRVRAHGLDLAGPAQCRARAVGPRSPRSAGRSALGAARSRFALGAVRSRFALGAVRSRFALGAARSGLRARASRSGLRSRASRSGLRARASRSGAACSRFALGGCVLALRARGLRARASRSRAACSRCALEGCVLALRARGLRARASRSRALRDGLRPRASRASGAARWQGEVGAPRLPAWVGGDVATVYQARLHRRRSTHPPPASRLRDTTSALPRSRPRGARDARGCSAHLRRAKRNAGRVHTGSAPVFARPR